MTRSYIDSRLARRLRHGRKKQTGLVLGRSVFSIARRVRLPGRPAGASVGGYTARFVFVYFRREPTEPTVKSGEKTGVSPFNPNRRRSAKVTTIIFRHPAQTVDRRTQCNSVLPIFPPR
ncbi:hypothetical protein J6590_008880 [Homalodisca vitripennis]|nr:hypothetical protein J6590_008880 [Homalodisca vitripennis]